MHAKARHNERMAGNKSCLGLRRISRSTTITDLIVTRAVSAIAELLVLSGLGLRRRMYVCMYVCTLARLIQQVKQQLQMQNRYDGSARTADRSARRLRSAMYFNIYTKYECARNFWTRSDCGSIFSVFNVVHNKSNFCINSTVLLVLTRTTSGQSNLTKSASRRAHSPVRGHPRGSKFVPLNSWGRGSY